MDQICGVLTKLIPFVLTIVTYFTQFVPLHSKIADAFIKCLPIVCLIIFVGLCSMDMDREAIWYVRVIILGLIFCGAGDAILVWHHLFELGVLAFAIGHICYMIAFGFEPLAWRLGIGVGICATGLLGYLGPNVDEVFQLIGVIIYAYIIFAMVWRALARLTIVTNWSWSKFLTAFGAIIFATSDLMLALNKFIVELDNSREIIMSTYYTAQLLIALSVLEPRMPTKQITVWRWTIWCI
ncbi:YhhN family [Popillia japonica]|uniref:lysoplasmalogenase n=1 Tax=Popillia japonica TaxID=7064 RepID=A0AAW1J0F6_POPJA